MGKKHLRDTVIDYEADDTTNTEWMDRHGTWQADMPWTSISASVPLWRLWKSLSPAERLAREANRPDECPYELAWDRLRLGHPRSGWTQMFAPNSHGRIGYGGYGQRKEISPEDLFYCFPLRAFDTYPKLEILAFGDFSYNGRCEKRHILLARDATSEARLNSVSSIPRRSTTGQELRSL